MGPVGDRVLLSLLWGLCYARVPENLLPVSEEEGRGRQPFIQTPAQTPRLLLTRWEEIRAPGGWIHLWIGLCRHPNPLLRSPRAPSLSKKGPLLLQPSSPRKAPLPHLPHARHPRGTPIFGQVANFSVPLRPSFVQLWLGSDLFHRLPEGPNDRISKYIRLLRRAAVQKGPLRTWRSPQPAQTSAVCSCVWLPRSKPPVREHLLSSALAQRLSLQRPWMSTEHEGGRVQGLGPQHPAGQLATPIFQVWVSDE